MASKRVPMGHKPRHAAALRAGYYAKRKANAGQARGPSGRVESAPPELAGRQAVDAGSGVRHYQRRFTERFNAQNAG